jgi:cytochrome c oxidase subunit II
MKSKFTLFVLLLAGFVVITTTSGIGSAQSSQRTIEVTAKRFAFDPAEITLKKGEPVDIVIKSMDVAHGLRFRELNLETKVPKGGSTELRFTPDKTGDFVGHCSVFCGSGHGGMALTLHVVD